MNEPIATILIPTTGDRWSLLQHAVWSIQRQTEQRFEVLIVGDGVSDATRDWVRQISQSDPRIRFFDFPKHPRRGEENRDLVLQQAKGRFICYMCDRDLYLPEHVATLANQLHEADFSFTLPVLVDKEDHIWCRFEADLRRPKGRRDAGRARNLSSAIPLSCAAHTLEFYRKLERGWSTTPRTRYTDAFMWSKFLQRADCRVACGCLPTVIYLPRESHPGWPVPAREREMLRWRQKMGAPDFRERYLAEVLAAQTRCRIDEANLSLAGHIKRVGYDLVVTLATEDRFAGRWLLRGGRMLKQWFKIGPRS